MLGFVWFLDNTGVMAVIIEKYLEGRALSGEKQREETSKQDKQYRKAPFP